LTESGLNFSPLSVEKESRYYLTLSDAILPVVWISTTTHDRRNYYSVWIDSIQNGIGKLKSQITTNMAFNDRPTLWRSDNLKYGTLYGVDKIQLSVLLGKKIHSLPDLIDGQKSWKHCLELISA
jgi:hypothetical protein